MQHPSVDSRSRVVGVAFDVCGQIEQKALVQVAPGHRQAGKKPGHCRRRTAPKAAAQRDAVFASNGKLRDAFAEGAKGGVNSSDHNVRFVPR